MSTAPGKEEFEKELTRDRLMVLIFLMLVTADGEVNIPETESMFSFIHPDAFERPLKNNQLLIDYTFRFIKTQSREQLLGLISRNLHRWFQPVSTFRTNLESMQTVLEADGHQGEEELKLLNQLMKLAEE